MHKKIIGLLFLFAVGVGSLSAQTTVEVNYSDGSQQSYNVTEAGKLYFDDINLLINTDGTSLTSIPYATVSSITLAQQTLATGEVKVDKESIMLYPNPATNFIKINNKNKTGLVQVQIYSASGELVKQGKYPTNSEINISDLPAGVYIVKANENTLKLIKK